MSGVQALVRLMLDQRRRDRAAGLDTAGFVSGYRGSPLGGLDKSFWQAEPFLDTHQIRFVPGLNEDLAATSVWGTQQVNLFPGARHDGVFGLWYGKGPGVDRSGDVLKHANAAGTSPLGGVLAIAGDDHACKSSTLPHQSEYAFMDAQMPVLNPSGVQEILDLGLAGFALSRYSGCWVGFKTIAETVDSSATVNVDAGRLRWVQPDDFELPDGGVHIRWPDRPLDQEFRLQRYKLYAALAFARANGLNRVVIDSPSPRLGLVTTGKSYLDVRQALEDLGIDEALAARLGLRVLKVGMSWPLDREIVRRFAEGLAEVLVVEEKRAVIENQLKEQLYNWREDVRPSVYGKFDDEGEWMLPSASELTPARIARVLAARIQRYASREHTGHIRDRLEFLDDKERALAEREAMPERVPHYCSGCPHNTSTRVPEGSRAMAGIGCHYMATWMNRSTETFTQMGGEGVPWIGQAPFTETGHVFANLGDGTYFHSGILAIRAAVAANVNITYKLLYNDAVAMTGGQPVDGPLTVRDTIRQLEAEGVQRIVVVSDAPEKYTGVDRLGHGIATHHRDDLDSVQRSLRETGGVSVLIYDQTCATEKRRRRKRGLMPQPDERLFINEAACEGCGDCGVQSSCLAIVPVDTALGRKRAIDQNACNMDFSCAKGFCPSFVSVRGAKLKKPALSTAAPISEPLPEPMLPELESPYGIVVTGVGGTGVVTIGALLGMAAHLEGKGASVLDMTGLAQKFGAVVSHVRIAQSPADISAVRVAAGGAKLLLGCDVVVAAGAEALAKCDARHTRAVINAHQTMTAAFLNDRDATLPVDKMRATIAGATGGRATFVDASALATKLTGDTIGANLFMIGVAYQQGLLPLSAASLTRAIELNGVAVEANQRAFDWGRCYVTDPKQVEKAGGRAPTVVRIEPQPRDQLNALIERNAAHLAAYQDDRYARRYRDLVESVRASVEALTPGRSGLIPDRSGLTRAVAENYARLMAYKDEYEVARLYTDPAFMEQLANTFEPGYTLEFHLSPPLLARVDPQTGRPSKSRYGPWMMRAFHLLARLKRLRATPFDPFRYTRERKLERRLIADYESNVTKLLEGLSQDNYAVAVAIARLPEEVRGFGPVKLAAIDRAREREAELWAQFERPDTRNAA
ncbi:MAG: indolepyruvate ferredoxin oxidoreductase family protein [Gammaproteobacteria bacterium]